MARISGVDLPKDKRIDIGLTYVLWDRSCRRSGYSEESGG